MADKVNQDTHKLHPEVFKTLCSRTSEMNAQMAEVRGELGSFIKNAENDHGINRKAFKLVTQLERMEQSKLADFLRSFDYYRELAALDDAAGLDMFDVKPSNITKLKPNDGVSAAIAH